MISVAGAASGRAQRFLRWKCFVNPVATQVALPLGVHTARQECADFDIGPRRLGRFIQDHDETPSRIVGASVFTSMLPQLDIVPAREH